MARIPQCLLWHHSHHYKQERDHGASVCKLCVVLITHPRHVCAALALTPQHSAELRWSNNETLRIYHQYHHE